MTRRFSAVLLTGGKSTRMGRDKALLEMGGVPLWERQLRMLEQLAPAEIFLAGPRPPGCAENRVVAIEDAHKNSGPLGALVSALRKCSTPLLLALAVDLPRMRVDYLQELLELCAEEQGVVPFTERMEPLVAIYPVHARSVAEELLVGGDYSLQAFARRCLAAGSVSKYSVSLPQRKLFLNVNTPTELKELLRNGK